MLGFMLRGCAFLLKVDVRSRPSHPATFRVLVMTAGGQHMPGILLVFRPQVTPWGGTLCSAADNSWKVLFRLFTKT